ncbi:MAG: hypothetical protein IRY99_22620 [Isosphaeraceae bacterium]|nr:hypothetical protein [Isosphaeraceae bacterium]
MKRAGLLVALGTWLALAAPASAELIAGPNWMVDTPTIALVTLDFGPILANDVLNLGPFVSPAGNWQIDSLMIVEIDKATPGFANDFVAAVPTITHLVAPHAGEIAPGNPITSTMAASATPLMTTDAAGQGPHPNTGDLDTLGIAIRVTAMGADITGYTVAIALEHEVVIPEPSTIGLAGTAALTLLVCGWLRRRLTPD